MEGIITISPAFIPIDKKARCRAEVPLLQTAAYLEPVYFLISFSNSITFGPVVK